MSRKRNIKTKSFREMQAEKGYDPLWVQKSEEQETRAEYLKGLQRTLKTRGKGKFQGVETLEQFQYREAKKGKAARKLAQLHQQSLRATKDEFAASIPGDAARALFNINSPPSSPRTPPQTPELHASPTLVRTMTPVKLARPETQPKAKPRKRLEAELREVVNNIVWADSELRKIKKGQANTPRWIRETRDDLKKLRKQNDPKNNEKIEDLEDTLKYLTGERMADWKKEAQMMVERRKKYVIEEAALKRALSEPRTRPGGKGKAGKPRVTTRAAAKKKHTVIHLTDSDDESGGPARPPGGGGKKPPPDGGPPKAPATPPKKKKKKTLIDLLNEQSSKDASFLLQDKDLWDNFVHKYSIPDGLQNRVRGMLAERVKGKSIVLKPRADIPEEKRATPNPKVTVAVPDPAIPNIMGEDEKSGDPDPMAAAKPLAVDHAMHFAQQFGEEEINDLFAEPKELAKHFQHAGLLTKQEQLQAIEAMKEVRKDLSDARNQGETHPHPQQDYDKAAQGHTDKELLDYLQRPDPSVPDIHKPGILAAVKKELARRQAIRQAQKKPQKQPQKKQLNQYQKWVQKYSQQDLQSLLTKKPLFDALMKKANVTGVHIQGVKKAMQERLATFAVPKGKRGPKKKVMLPKTRIDPPAKKKVKPTRTLQESVAMRNIQRIGRKEQRKMLRQHGYRRRIARHKAEWQGATHEAALLLAAQRKEKQKAYRKKKAQARYGHGEMKEARLQIQQEGPGSYSVRSTGMTKKVKEHIQHLLNRLSGKLVLDGKKMSQKQAFNYLVKQLIDRKTVQVEIVQ